MHFKPDQFILKEAIKKIAALPEVEVLLVDVYINSRLYSIAGNWSWEMNSNSVFCSDVMAALSQDYSGTKAIIHPDDIDYVKEKIAGIQTDAADIEFRIITTYGEVKTISGKDCSLNETDTLRISDPGKDILEKIIRQTELEKNNESFYLLKQISDHAETITNTGTWFINTATLQTEYSDNVYRIHGITPQSLNAHPHTFNIFIHPEDTEAFTEVFDKAFREKLPLHLEYRIITDGEKERFITLITHWSRNLNGEDIFNGLITDKTESVFAFTKTEQAENALEFHRKILQLSERLGSTAFWYINLLTRQTFYSDNYFRLHGLKPQSIPARPAIFLNYVHPDDREKVAESINKIRTEHVPPDIEYRIIRADKKFRYIKQKGELISFGGNELIMTCTLQDVTPQIQIEKKLQELSENILAKDFVQAQSEEMAKISSWMWEPATNNFTWSDNMYELLGFKKTVKELSQDILLKAVLPEDRKLFKDEINTVTEGIGDREFNFRILKIGEVRNMKACMKLINYQERKFFIGTMQDVTESLQMQNELNENLQLNQLLTENILDRIFITDVHNNIILWNKKCEQFFNIKREAITGKNYFDVFPEQKNEKIINRFNNVLKGEPIHEQGERSSAKKYHDLHMIPLREKNNKIIGIIHIMHDVTKEIYLHNNLNERLAFIEKLLEETVDRIIVLDKNLTYKYWNKKAEQHYHINKEYVIGKNLLEVFPSFVNDPFYLKIKRVLKGETVHESSAAETEHQEKFSETYLIPLLSNQKEVTGILWIVHDLSKEVALRIAEDELDKKEKNLEKINNDLVRQNKIYEYAEQIANMGTWVWNPVTDKAHYSDNMFRLFGVEPQSLVPNFENIMKFIHPEDKEKQMLAAQELREGTPIIVEYRIIRADGITRNFRNRTQIIKNNNEDIVIGTTEDITEVYEKDLAQKTSELLLKKKDEFISIASHELKTPVTNIKASLQILQELVSQPAEKESLKPFVDMSARQANKLAELVNDLLDSAMLSEENISLKKSLFNVKEAIQESADEIQNVSKDSIIKIEGNTEPEVFADRIRLQQVITNFITNAVKYSPVDKNVIVKIDKNKKQVKVSVTDKGIGIAEDKISQVFDKYFRVDESSKKFTGLGLGLYISKEIIKKHGGTVGVKSAADKGSVFWFTLPL